MTKAMEIRGAFVRGCSVAWRTASTSIQESLRG